MIIDLERFVCAARPHWEELEVLLDFLQRDPYRRIPFDKAQRLHYLYEKASSDLARLAAVSTDLGVRSYLEALVARAYGEIHVTRHPVRRRLTPLRWFFTLFPQALRRHTAALWLTVAVTVAGSLFGGAAVLVDPRAREALLPFGHAMQTPAERVANEEDNASADPLKGHKGSFSAYLMTNNIRVSVFTLALGITCGVGTMLIIFYNGVMVGAICADYVQGGQGEFLAGWLLPHGSVEIPAILIAGQASFIIAGALLGRGRRDTLRQRLRQAGPDVMLLIYGVACLLVWAGIVEAFFSQYHEPALPYWVKISFGSVELVALIAFLTLAGRDRAGVSHPHT